MKSTDDIEKLWRQINADLDNNDDLELNQYLQSKGVFEHKAPESLNITMSHLIDHALLPDEVVDQSFKSKYKIIRQLASGGQSDIYLAERSDGVYQQTVVIKFISKRFNQSTSKKQFLQEMQLLADLKHPVVVSILDSNMTDNGQPWLVLDYIEGAHIDDYVSDQNLSTQDIVCLIMNICEILQFIHKRQVLHKDIKPNNILIKQINKVPYPV